MKIFQPIFNHDIIVKTHYLLREYLLYITYSYIFRLIHTISVSISPGYGLVALTPTYDVQLGDVIAHDGQATPLIASTAPGVPLGTVNDYYCSGQVAPSTVGLSNCVLTTEVHQLRAIYAETSEVIYPLEFTMPGNVSFEVNVYS
jgi:hypothetical protein